MYLVVAFDFPGRFEFFSLVIEALARKCRVDARIISQKQTVYVAVKEEQNGNDAFFKLLDQVLPASIFLKGAKVDKSDTLPKDDVAHAVRLPVNIAPCPTCQKEMFDVASRRYYYPFTSCNACGAQHTFLERYPFERRNTLMRFFVPCDACQEELTNNPFRLNYPLISCVECGIAMKMTDGKSERFANTKGEYRRLFEVSARALMKNKRVVMKTQNGYRLFFLPEETNVTSETTVLFASAEALNEHLMMVPEEFDALLCIERPVVRVATKSETFKRLFGSSVRVKYADEGVSMLLARELLNASQTYIAYLPCDATTDADYRVDFDLPIRPQRDIELFINRDIKRIVHGERVVYPLSRPNDKPVMVVANDLVAVPYEKQTLIDTTELFDTAEVSEVRVLEGETFDSTHNATVRFPAWKAAMLSVLAEHDRLDQTAIGVHFDRQLSFLYYNGKKALNILPSEPFDATKFWERIASLREGSDRLVQNFRKKFPDIVARFDAQEGKMDMFQAAAILMGLKQADLDGISAEALTFLGKGGLQVDTRVSQNRFDAYAFLASIMSYKTADVPNDILCYSIYESFGDYIGEIVEQISEKMKSRCVVLTGETFGNQALFARIERSLKPFERLMNETLPIGKENAVYGGLFI